MTLPIDKSMSPAMQRAIKAYNEDCEDGPVMLSREWREIWGEIEMHHYRQTDHEGLQSWQPRHRALLDRLNVVEHDLCQATPQSFVGVRGLLCVAADILNAHMTDPDSLKASGPAHGMVCRAITAFEGMDNAIRHYLDSDEEGDDAELLRLNQERVTRIAEFPSDPDDETLDRLGAELREIEQAMITTPATTMQGLWAKAALVADTVRDASAGEEPTDQGDRAALALVQDIERMTGGAS